MKKITFGPVEVGLSAVLLLVAGIVGYQFADIKDDSADTLANAEQQTDANQAEVINTTEEESKEVKIPAEESTETQKVEEQAQEATKPEDQTPPDAQQLTITIQAGQTGGVVKASANISEPLSGTCLFMFKKSGYSNIEKTVTITNGNTCETSVATSSFGATGDWTVYVIVKDKNYTKKGYTTTTISVKN